MQHETIGKVFITNSAVRLTLSGTDDLQAGRGQTVHCSFISGYT
jgi:hypothetical protein